MPVVNPLARELVFKIVYYGPGLGGKTTTLQHIHSATRAEHRGKMVSLATPVDRTLYFDFLPIRVPNLRGLGVRLQLFTVPGQVYYNATRKLVLTGADGVVFVADSQRDRLDADLESLANLAENLREHGRPLEELPFVLAYNKRDLPGIVAIDELNEKLNSQGAGWFATSATLGEGVFETLDAITKLVLEDFERRAPESSEAIPGGGFGYAEGGLTDALRMADAEFGAEDSVQPPIRSRMSSPRTAVPSSLPASGPSEFPSSSAPPLEAAILPMPHTAAAESGIPPVTPVEKPPGRGVTFLPAWPPEERALAHEVEGNLSRGEWAAAVLGCGSLVRRALGRCCPMPEMNEETLTVSAYLAGVDGPRYLWLRGLIAKARSGSSPPGEDAVFAYAFALEVSRLARVAGPKPR